jgi:cytochrome c oxidase subunit 2
MGWSDWTLPPGASTFVGEIDWLYYLILAVTGVAFVLVEIGLIAFIVKYRRRPGQKAYYTHGYNRAEYIWTGFTAVVVVVIGVLSAPAWARIKGRDAAPPDAYPVAIRAKQFEWFITYPGSDGRLGTGDDFEVRNQLHLAVNRPVAVTLTSEDAIHAFFVPAFRVKQDAVPGMRIPMWFQPTQTGEFEIACAELCGLGHYRMRAMATVHSPEDYDRWLAERTRTAAVERPSERPVALHH